MIGAGEIEYMRETIEDALPGTAVIHAVTTTSDGLGGATEAWAAAGTVSCRLSPRQSTRGTEGVRGDQISAVNDWIVTLPWGSTVTEANRLVIDSETYEVTRCRSPRSWQFDMRVEAVKVA